jgi:hypothetical protein
MLPRRGGAAARWLCDDTGEVARWMLPQHDGAAAKGLGVAAMEPRCYCQGGMAVARCYQPGRRCYHGMMVLLPWWHGAAAWHNYATAKVATAVLHVGAAVMLACGGVGAGREGWWCYLPKLTCCRLYRLPMALLRWGL